MVVRLRHTSWPPSCRTNTGGAGQRAAARLPASMAWPRRSTAARCRHRPPGGGRVKFDVDDMVRQGDVLVVIEDTQHQAGVRQAGGEPEGGDRKRQDAEQDFARIQGVYERMVSRRTWTRSRMCCNEARAGEQVAQAAPAAGIAGAPTRRSGPCNGIVTERLIGSGRPRSQDATGIRPFARQHAGPAWMFHRTWSSRFAGRKAQAKINGKVGHGDGRDGVPNG